MPLTDDDWDNGAEEVTTPPTPKAELPAEDVVVLTEAELAALPLEVDRIQYRWNSETSQYDTLPDNGDVSEASDGPPDYTPTHAFVMARTFSPTDRPNVFNVSKKLHVWSPFFAKIAREVLEGYANIAWGAKPLKVRENCIANLCPADVLISWTRRTCYLSFPDSTSTLRCCRRSPS